MNTIKCLCFSIIILLYAHSGYAESCKTIDKKYLIDGNETLNTLVCDAFRAYSNHDNEKAISLFNEVINTEIFESPNFIYFPILSELHWRINDEDNARKYLSYSKLTLEVFLGMIKCRWNGFSTTDHINVVDALRTKSIGIYQFDKRIDDEYADDVFMIMCQENMIDSYSKTTDLDVIYNLSKEYFEIKTLMNGNK